MAGLLSATNCIKSCFAMTSQLMLRRGATATTIHCSRKLFFRRRKYDSASIDINPSKSEYEVELEKVIKNQKVRFMSMLSLFFLGAKFEKNERF